MGSSSSVPPRTRGQRQCGVGCSQTQLVPRFAKSHEPDSVYQRLTLPIENFSTQDHHVKSIKDENKIYSATGSGKIPWVATRDIAAVAHHALTTPQAPNKDFMVLGGRLYTYTEVSTCGSLVFILTGHQTDRKEH